MTFHGFEQKDFATFHINGLDERMKAIKERIQPKFRVIGEQLSMDLSAMSGSEMYLHIAQHARRTVNPPRDTWLAISANRRGYKMLPHFQVGLFDDHVFQWLAFIYELPGKSDIATTFLQSIDKFRQEVPEDFVISTDHMQKAATPVTDIDLEQTLVRFRDVKKAELLIGRQIASDDPLLKDGKAFLKSAIETFEALLPLYHLAGK